MKAAVYIRVSTDEQTVDNQLPACLEACKARGWTPIKVAEVGSGTKKRQGWEGVREMARKKEIGAVVVWALDRMGRTLWGICDAIREFDDLGIRVVSVSEPWVDSDAGMFRDLLIRVFDWVSAFERQRLRERIKAGQETARGKGTIIGRPRRFSIDELAYSRELRLQGKSWNEIRAALWSRFRKRHPKATVAAAVTRDKEKRGAA